MIVNNLQELLSLKPSSVGNTLIHQEELIRWFDLLDAVWIHDGDPTKPHAKTTQGLCTNAFFDCLAVLENMNLSDIFANQLALRLKYAMGEEALKKVGYVVGSPMAAITFAHDVARYIGAPRNSFAEKDPDHKNEMMWKRRTIAEGTHVLKIEELMTTSGTTEAVERAIVKGNKYPVIFDPFVGTIILRPPKFEPTYGGKRVVALIAKEVWAVEREKCTLCAQGSKLIEKPKLNWGELTGKN